MARTSSWSCLSGEAVLVEDDGRDRPAAGRLRRLARRAARNGHHLDQRKRCGLRVRRRRRRHQYRRRLFRHRHAFTPTATSARTDALLILGHLRRAERDPIATPMAMPTRCYARHADRDSDGDPTRGLSPFALLSFMLPRIARSPRVRPAPCRSIRDMRVGEDRFHIGAGEAAAPGRVGDEAGDDRREHDVRPRTNRRTG